MSHTNACPSPVELTRVFSTGVNDETSAHLERCEHCAAQWASIERVAALAAELPDLEPTEQRVADVRRSLLGAATLRDAGPRRAVLHPFVLATAAAAAIALALVGYLALRTPATAQQETQPTQAADIYRAVVHAHVGASHAIVGSQPDEIVRLTDGKATFEVEHLHSGERFRVVTGDAEVEVRGTVFDVSVADDQLLAVHVISGVVEVRYLEIEVVTLSAGDWWRRPETERPARPSDEEAPAVATVATARPHRPTAATSSTAPASHAAETAANATPRADAVESASNTPAPSPNPQVAFETGWSALRSGDFQSAESSLGAAAAGSDPIAEDAAFWHAVALARAGRSAQAARSFQSFLTRFPGSPRAGEASVMLGRMLLAAGNLGGAEARFRAALGDPGARIRASAAAGIAEVEKRRNGQP